MGFLREKLVAETCETCRFWKRDKNLEAAIGGLQGYCHRYPPKAREASMKPSVFPPTPATQWCGEWVEQTAQQSVHR